MGKSSVDAALASVAFGFAVATSHTIAVLSVLPLARYLPSRENASAHVLAVCFSRLLTSFCVSTSQRRTLPSEPALARCLPSGEKTTLRTALPLPGRTAFSLPVWASHNLML